MPLDDIIEAIGHVVGGWCHIFSHRYRQKKHREWREQSWIGMPFEVVSGFFGIVLSFGLLGLAAFVIWKSLIH